MIQTYTPLATHLPTNPIMSSYAEKANLDA